MITGTRHTWTCVLFAPALLLACEAGSVLVGRAGEPVLDPVDDPEDPPAIADGDADADADPPAPIDCDRDLDGWENAACGGDDCNDDDAEVHPDAVESEDWSIQVIADDAAWPAIAIDNQGAAHVVLRGDTSSGAPVLRYLTNLGGSWESEDIAVLGESSFSPAIAVGVDRRVHMCWTTTDGGTNVLVYASNFGHDWRVQTLLSSMGPPTACAIAVDLRGVVHVAAQDPNTGTLRYLSLVGGLWSMENVSDTATVGATPSMLVDVQYLASIGYQETDGSLHYATRSPTGWHLETLFEAGVSGARSVGDFALAPDGSVHTSYRDAHVRTLHYATNESGAWESLMLESAGYSGKASSVAVDPNGAAHVAYSRDDMLDRPDDLVFRTDAAGFWSNAQTIDEDGSTGLAPHLAVGLHTLHVVFFRVGVADHPEALHGRRALPDAIDRDCDGTL